MKQPVVTIIVATFNSEKTLPLVLESVRQQTYPQEKIEILVVDGGSTDKTLAITRKFKCRVVKNPRTEPVYGKYLGYLKAEGDYALYLDHDEVIENKKSISLKLEAFKVNSRVKAVIGTGYQSPRGYPFINDYINEFGDPFSFFIYRLSKDANFFIPTMKKRYPVVSETEDLVVLDFFGVRSPPIIELVAGGSMFDIRCLKKSCPETTKRMELLPHFFYLLCSAGHSQVAITKNDILTHYSADTFRKYLTKIRWRVKNNIYHTSSLGVSGFTGREKFASVWSRLKKFLFIPYSFSLVLPLLDSTHLIISRRKPFYLLHLPLTFYTASLVVYHYCLKTLGARPKLKSYDELKEVNGG